MSKKTEIKSIIPDDDDNDTQKKRKNILRFIVNNFDEYDRMQGINKGRYEITTLFKSEINFFKYNKTCLLKMSKADIDFLDILCNKIKDNKIFTTDMDNFVEWRANVIYFNKLEQLVIARHSSS